MRLQGKERKGTKREGEERKRKNMMKGRAGK